MNAAPNNVPGLPSAWTFNDLLKLVPPGWRRDRCLVGTQFGNVLPIERVVFEINRSGRKCIILSPIETKVERP